MFKKISFKYRLLIILLSFTIINNFTLLLLYINNMMIVHIVVISIFFSILSILISFFVSNRIKESILEMNSSIKSIIEGDYTNEIDNLYEIKDKDLYDLALNINDMITKIKYTIFSLEEEIKNRTKILVKKEKLSAIGNLVASISHELNTPIAVILSYIRNMPDFFLKFLKSFHKCNFENYYYLISFLNDISFKMIPIEYENKFRDILIKQLENISGLKCDIEDCADKLLSIGITDIEKYEDLIIKEDFDLIIDYIVNIKNISIIKTASDRLSMLVLSLQSFFRKEITLDKYNVNDAVIMVLTILLNRIKNLRLKIVRNYSSVPDIICNKEDINQVVLNLIQNSIQSIEQKGNANKDGYIKIDLIDDADYIIFKVTDNGVGIDKAIQDKLFEPFFTTKLEGAGMGIGLHIVKEAVSRHKGRINISSNKFNTVFEVSFYKKLRKEDL